MFGKDDRKKPLLDKSAVGRIRAAKRFLVAVFILFTLGIVLAGATFYRHQEAGLKRRTLEVLASIAELKVREITAWRSERIGDGLSPVRNAFTAAAVRDFLARPDDSRLRERIYVWMRGLQESFGYRDVLLLDPHGAVQASVPEGVSIEPRVLDQVLIAPPGNLPLFTDFHQDPNGKIILSIFTSVPNPDRPGMPAGFFVLQIDPEKYLYPFIQLWPTPSPTGETLLVERQGDDLVYLNDLRHRKGTALILRRPLSQIEVPAVRAVHEKKGSAEGIDYRGERVLAAYRPVPGTPWVMVAKVDRREVYAQLRSDTLLLVALVLSLISGTGTVLFSFAGRLTDRLTREQQSAMVERDRARAELLETELRATEALRESEEKLR